VVPWQQVLRNLRSARTTQFWSASPDGRSFRVVPGHPSRRTPSNSLAWVSEPHGLARPDVNDRPAANPSNTGRLSFSPRHATPIFLGRSASVDSLLATLRYRLDLTGMRDKPRRSGRGRIAPGSLSEPGQTMLLQEGCRERDLPPGRGKVTPAEIRAAQQGTRPRNPAVPAAQAAQSESPGLRAGEDVNRARMETSKVLFLPRPEGRGLSRLPVRLPVWSAILLNAGDLPCVPETHCLDCAEGSLRETRPYLMDYPAEVTRYCLDSVAVLGSSGRSCRRRGGPSWEARMSSNRGESRPRLLRVRLGEIMSLAQPQEQHFSLSSRSPTTRGVERHVLVAR